MHKEIEAVVDRLRAKFPHVKDDSFSFLGSGLDHTVVDLDGKIVRLTKVRADFGLVVSECRLLDKLGMALGKGIPRCIDADFEHGILVLEKLAGNPLSEAIDDHRIVGDTLANQLGEFLTNLHGLPLDEFRGLIPFEDPDVQEYRDEAQANLLFLRGFLDATKNQQTKKFLNQSVPGRSYDVCVIHNDLGTEHLLVNDSLESIRGIIDWSDCCIGDPAIDFARLLRDLGPSFVEKASNAYGRAGLRSPDFMKRMRFFAACFGLEDARYGVEEGKASYTKRGFASLDLVQKPQ